MTAVSWTSGPRIYAYVGIVLGVLIINWAVFSGLLREGFSFNEVSRGLSSSSISGLQRNSIAISRNGRNEDPQSPASDKHEHDHEHQHEYEHSSRHSASGGLPFYPVCVLTSIGDATQGPNDRALPFPLLYRLFDAAKAEIYKFIEGPNARISKHLLEYNEQNDIERDAQVKLLVAVDFPSIVCEMARDSIHDFGVGLRGVGLICKSLEQLRGANGAKNISESPTTSCGTAIVGKSTRYVPQMTLDWTQLIVWDNLKVVDLDAHDASRDPPALPRESWRPTIVTAFSANHIPVALLMLRSLGRAGMEVANAGLYNISIVVYTLEDFNSTLQGILECVVRELNENYKVPTELRAFEFSAYPDWMRVNQSMHYDGVGKYGWKGVVVHTVLVERGFVLWVDAGCRYSAQALTETLDHTRNVGFTCKSSAGAVPQYVHSGLIKYYRYKVRYGPTRMLNCDTSGVGLTLDTYETVGRPFFDCSMTRQCIGPDGATRDEHRFDQSIMTLIVDMGGASCSGLSPKVKRHMDYRPKDYSGTYPSPCYKDPLEVQMEWQ